MLRLKKLILLFLALLFPACIFIFLKFFGKNEFTVPALFINEYPEGMNDCGVSVTLPYYIPDSVRTILSLSKQNLTLIHFEQLPAEGQKNLEKINRAHTGELKILSLQESDSHFRSCVFFLKEPNDLVLVDEKGTIIGQYVSSDRDEIDRLQTELSIMLKKY